jgi:DNA modification methylase
VPRPKPNAAADTIICGDALKLIPSVPDRSVALALFSPPYAEQRKKQYASVPEKEFPAWMRRIMAALRPKITDDGSVLIVIRSHVKDGVVSDYVLRTRLALREDRWNECEELIWLKPDGPPLGSKQRPRRTWEHILWFSKSRKPYIDLRANGTFSERIGFVGSHRLRNESNPIATVRPSQLQNGHTRTPDHFTALVSENENGIQHPATFPATLCEKLIRTFSREGDLVLDPFCGSGTTLVVAQRLGRKFVGFEISPKYVRLAQDRMATEYGKRTMLGSSNAVKLRPEFPATKPLRRAFLLSKGLNLSDVTVFDFILTKTAHSIGHVAAVPISLTEIANSTGLSRRTAIRCLERLRDGGFVVTVQHPESHRRNSSTVGVAPGWLMGI